MNEKEREQVALFRFGLIAPLYNGQVDTKTYLNEVEGKVNQITYYGERRIVAKTVQDWVLKYRKSGFEALNVFCKRKIHNVAENLS